MSKELTQEALSRAIKVLNEALPGMIEAMKWELCEEHLPTSFIDTIEICKAALDSETISVDPGFFQQQEPAAWMSDNHLNVTKHADIAESWKQHGGKPIPLYTKPAERLSDGEIEEIWYKLYPVDSNNYWSDVLGGFHLMKFARAIEDKLLGGSNE